MDKREFTKRRKRLMDIVDRGGIAIQPTAPEQLRNRDVYFPFRPDSDFFYLSGFAEPEAVLVLVPDRPQGECLLFCRENDPEAETWHGRRAGLEGACERYGADDAFPFSDLDESMPYTAGGAGSAFEGPSAPLPVPPAVADPQAL